MQVDAPTLSDRFTTIWTEVELPTDVFPPGTQGEVVVDLRGTEGSIVASVCQPLRADPVGG